MEISTDSSRLPMLSPKVGHKDYNRYKYYSALRTGYSHLGIEEPYLEPPSHVIDKELFLAQIPFGKLFILLVTKFIALIIVSPEEKHSSWIIIFSVWKTMVGTAVAILPWAFQQSGIILGLILCFTSFIISWYTCKLIIDMTGTDPDYSVTLKKFYGKTGFYIGLIAPAILILGAVATFFVTMNQVLYPMILAVTVWITGDKDAIHYKTTADWSWFSSDYTAILIFIVMTTICSMKSLKLFMKIGSYGVIFVCMLMIFIIYTGFDSISNTEFHFGTMEESNASIWDSNQRTLVLFYS